MTSKQRVSCSHDVRRPALLLLLLLVQLAATQTADCPHECIPIRECPDLLKLLDHPTQDDIKVLQDATCSYVGTDPIVCCLTSLLPKSCGQGPSLNRIIGGTETPLNGYTWMAVFGYLNRMTGETEFACGGAVINERYVLTAAHCVHHSVLRRSPLQFIRLGEWDLSTKVDCETTLLENFQDCADPVQDIEYEDIIIHSDYNSRGIQADDIALVRLSRPVDLVGGSIRPICLPPQGLEPRTVLGKRQAVVAGWGITENGTSSNRMLHVFLPLVDHGACNRTYNGIVLDQQLCFGGLAGQDSCKGDSGGPLMLSGPRGPPFQHIGVVSYGPVPCGVENKPGVYTSTSHYRNWIEQNLKP